MLILDNIKSEKFIQYLLDQKLLVTRFDKFLNEQTVEITELGKNVNAVLNKLLTTSKESEAINIQAAERSAKLD